MGFHLYLPMGYVYSATYFFMDTETVANRVNEAIAQRDKASAHPLERAVEARAEDDTGTPKAQADTSWEHLPENQRAAATEKG